MKYNRFLLALTLILFAAARGEAPASDSHDHAGHHDHSHQKTGKFEHDTRYASGYSDKKFASIKIGDTAEHVSSVIGAPLYEVWRYSREPYEFSVSSFETYKFKKPGMRIGGVCKGPDRDACYAWQKAQPLVHSFDEARTRFGEPDKKLWVYSESPSDKNYHKRALRIQDGRVDKIISEIYWD